MDILKTINDINGRDKAARFVQYLCRLLDYVFTKTSSSDKYKFLEYNLSTFRKLLRLGKSLESFYLARRNIQNEDILNRLSGLAKVAHGCYLFCDHFLLMKRLQLLQLNASKWATVANKYWLLAIIINLTHNYYELKRANEKLKKKHDDSSVIVSKLLKNNFLVCLDVIKNLCDIFIPLCALNYAKINSGIVGFLGMLSSIVGLIMIIIKPKN